MDLHYWDLACPCIRSRWSPGLPWSKWCSRGIEWEIIYFIEWLIVHHKPLLWQFCDHFAVFFRSESCSTTIPPALKLLSLRLNSILDDCCGSIEQLKVHAAASFSFQASSSIVKFSSPSISQFVRLACGTAAMTARMFATAVPPSVPHATAAKSVQTLVRMKVLHSWSHIYFHWPTLTLLCSSGATCWSALSHRSVATSISLPLMKLLVWNSLAHFSFCSVCPVQSHSFISWNGSPRTVLWSTKSCQMRLAAILCRYRCVLAKLLIHPIHAKWKW